MILKRVISVVMLSAFVALGIHAQNESWLSRKLRKGMNYIDSLWINKADSNYIEVPKNPWRVVIYPKFNEVYVKMHSDIDFNYLYGITPFHRHPLRAHLQSSSLQDTRHQARPARSFQ